MSKTGSLTSRFQHTSNYLLFVTNIKHKVLPLQGEYIFILGELFLYEVGGWAPVSHAIIPLSVHGVWRRQ